MGAPTIQQACVDGRKNIVAWSNYLRTLREFFESRGFYEVVTDHVVPAGAFEACLDTLKVEWAQGRGELHTSPEIEMKRLLAEGSGSIFQICQCFRDDPDTGVHRREFSMLEFYEVGANWEKVMELTKALITELSGSRCPLES
ncbi:MAG: amino acid--tRNA ligase-related protein [Bdellovibrionota bacterium]